MISVNIDNAHFSTKDAKNSRKTILIIQKDGAKIEVELDAKDAMHLGSLMNSLYWSMRE